MKSKIMGFIVTGLIILFVVGIAFRVPFLKKLVTGA